MSDSPNDRMAWELATESIVVRIRWFGIAMGYVLVQTRTGLHNPSAVRAFLALGAGYAALDTAFHRMGEVFLEKWPLFVSLIEATFIGLLCYHDTGLESPFRWYYLLSLICCAIRYRPPVAWWTFAFQCLSLASLAWIFRDDKPGLGGLPPTIVILAWSTWASSSLATLLKATGERLRHANVALERHRAELEERVAERTAALRASQARVLHQEKMAAFGLLAAGIAHEVGNPLAALSSLLQMLTRRGPDPYTAEKLDLAGRQLGRIERTVRDLVEFSRPASEARSRVRIAEVVEEVLGIAKYYQRTSERRITTEVPPDLPAVLAVRDHLTQVVLNLVLNAIDATEQGGQIQVEASVDEGRLTLLVADDGRGIPEADRARLFQPYFTTKPRGTGLGLFVSRQIVDELGGQLFCESEQGKGARFTVVLPALRNETRLLASGQGVAR
jgi:signal transduction histidine kinase